MISVKIPMISVTFPMISVTIQMISVTIPIITVTFLIISVTFPIISVTFPMILVFKSVYKPWHVDLWVYFQYIGKYVVVAEEWIPPLSTVLAQRANRGGILSGIVRQPVLGKV